MKSIFIHFLQYVFRLVSAQGLDSGGPLPIRGILVYSVLWYIRTPLLLLHLHRYLSLGSPRQYIIVVVFSH